MRETGGRQLRFVAGGDPADVATGRLTLQVVRAELARIVEQRAASDPHLHLVDGLSLDGELDATTDPLPGGLHPGPVSHRLIGERFGEAVPLPGMSR